jgi:hypothetical protein
MHQKPFWVFRKQPIYRSQLFKNQSTNELHMLSNSAYVIHAPFFPRKTYDCYTHSFFLSKLSLVFCVLNIPNSMYMVSLGYSNYLGYKQLTTLFHATHLYIWFQYNESHPIYSSRHYALTKYVINNIRRWGVVEKSCMARYSCLCKLEQRIWLDW